ncbi:MAG TPA: carboxypeptidase-like regulatory domain-containing protein, partial [Longimicrobiaceae bacterium]
MRLRFSPSSLLFAAIAATLVSRAAAAQTIVGMLLDRDGETPLAGVRVALVAVGGGQLAAEGRTDEDGRFTLTAPSAGAYRVRAEPAGAPAMLFAAVTLAAGERKSLDFQAHAPTAADSAVALAPVVGVAEPHRQVLERRGFYQRQRVYPGRFLTHDQFVALHGPTPLQKIRELGIMLELEAGDRFHPYRLQRGQRCYIAIYIDAVPVTDLAFLQLTNDRIAGEEYHTADDIPGEFNPHIADRSWRCGSPVIWTQQPGQPPA